MIEPDAITIRRATVEDWDAFVAINEEADALHRAHLPWMFQRPSGDRALRQRFDEQLTSTDAALFVAEVRGVVGVACILLRSAPDLEMFVQQRWAVLDYVVVTASMRRLGVGSALVAAAEAWARGHGVAWIELGVYEFNEDARRLYESLGYGRMSTRMRKPLTGTT